MRKFDAPNPAFHRLANSLCPSAFTDPCTGSHLLHRLGGKQAIASSGALLTQPALLLQQESDAATAEAAQPAVASSSIVLGSVCAVPQGNGSGPVAERLSSLFPGTIEFVFVAFQAACRMWFATCCFAFPTPDTSPLPPPPRRPPQKRKSPHTLPFPPGPPPSPGSCPLPHFPTPLPPPVPHSCVYCNPCGHVGLHCMSRPSISIMLSEM